MPTTMDQAKADTVRQILGLGVASMGVGAGGRALLGIRELLQRRKPIPFISPGPSPLEFPILTPRDEMPPEEEDLGALAQKVANNQGMLDQVANWVGQRLPDPPLDVTHMSRAPWAPPLIAGAAVGGGAAGWKVTDWLLKRRQKAELDAELNAAKKRYQDVLFSQQAGWKQAGENPYGQLDVLFDTYQEKRAETSWKDLLSLGAGGYLTALGAAGLGAGYMTYKWTKKQSPAKLLDQAMKERARQLWMRGPQQVAAIPKRVPMPEAA